MVGLGLMTRRPNPNTQARKVGVLVKDGRAYAVYRGGQGGMYHYAGGRTRKYYLTESERARVATGYMGTAAQKATTKVRRRSRKQSAPRRSYFQ